MAFRKAKDSGYLVEARRICRSIRAAKEACWIISLLYEIDTLDHSIAQEPWMSLQGKTLRQCISAQAQAESWISLRDETHREYLSAQAQAESWISHQDKTHRQHLSAQAQAEIPVSLRDKTRRRQASLLDGAHQKLAQYTEDADEALVSWFLAHGSDPDIAPKNADFTALSLAVVKAPFSIIQSLFVRSPHPKHGDLLHCASERALDDCKEVVCLILDRCDFGVNDIMYQNHIWSFYYFRNIVGLGTALHEAARCGRPEVIQVLLEHGADPLIKDTKNRTALEVAELHNNHAVIGSLQRADAAVDPLRGKLC